MDGVPSWSQHQKLQEEWIGTKGTLTLVIYISDPHIDLVPQEILVMATKIARGMDWYKGLSATVY